LRRKTDDRRGEARVAAASSFAARELAPNLLGSDSEKGRRPKEQDMDDRNRAGLHRRVAVAAVGAVLVGIAGCEPGTDRDTGRDPTQPSPELGVRSPLTGQVERDRTDVERGGRDEASPADPSAVDAQGDRPARAIGDEERVAVLQSSPVGARAVIEPTEGSDARGEASFIETDEGLEIVVTMTGLTPGPHGIHIHENGDCSGPKAEAAGSHFNPDGTNHGAPSSAPTERHAGDLGNLHADDQGNAELAMTMPDLELQGDRGVVGKAMIVHSGEDDLMSQPSGESGDPVACGVIEARATG